MEWLLGSALVGAGESRFSSRHIGDGSFNWTASPEFASLVRATGNSTLSSTQSNIWCTGTDATNHGTGNARVSQHTQTVCVKKKDSATQTFDSKADNLHKTIDTLLATNQTLSAKVTRLQFELRVREEEAANMYRERKRDETAKHNTKMILKMNKATHRTQKASRLAKQLLKQR